MTLPADKLAELHIVVLEFQNKQRASKKQLQRLAGKLNWACRVVYGGRTFLRRILDTMNALSPSGKFRLDSSFRSDIAWWVNFLRIFNGTRMFLDHLATVDVSTDACPVAAGGYFRGDWFYHHFSLDSPEWQNLNINHKETLAIVLAAQRWGPLWSHQRVVIHSDNQAAVQIINKGITASPVVMNALRKLFWLSALYNFHITAVYLAGTDNALADSISRMHETTGLHNFYAFLCSKFSTVSAQSRWLRICRFTALTTFSFRSTGSYPSSTAHRGSSVLSFPAFRYVYQSDLQNPPQHLLSLLQSHGLHTCSCANTTSSSICRLFGSFAKTTISSWLPKHYWYFT